MTLHSWALYLGLVLVATSTPGPAVLFIMTHSTLYGWKKATFAALGNITGLLLLGIIAVTGLGAVLKASEAVFMAVKYAGASYLIYLGVKLFLQKHSGLRNLENPSGPSTISPVRIYCQAVGVAVSNPKAIVFLTALFPQFLLVDQPLLPQFSALILTLMGFSFSFLMLYSLLAHRARIWVMKPERMRRVSRTSGAAFVGFGILLAASSNR